VITLFPSLSRPIGETSHTAGSRTLFRVPLTWGRLPLLLTRASSLSAQPISDESRKRFSRRMSPADTKRVARWVGVDLMSLFGIEVVWLKQSGAEPDRRFVRSSRVFDVEIEMHLLRSSIRPFGRNVVRRQLHTDAPLAGGIDNAVKTVVPKDVSAEDPGPERALGV
jgi:hypothetical protein